MVLTLEEKKARKKIAWTKWYDNNKEKNKEKCKKYQEENKEKMKEYRENNKERKKEYNQTPKGKKVKTLSQWKTRGLIHEDMSALYEQYLNATNCEECDVEFGLFAYVGHSGTLKCMDHEHLSGSFRNFLCWDCNIKRGE